jgi:hypothetical protein
MAPKDPLGAQTGCGFYGHDGTLAVTEATLRASIAAAALAERTIWWVSASTTPQKESDDTRFGDLVRYWLAGQTGLIPPGAIDAALKAALDPSVKYANLADATLNAAIREFAKAEKKVTDATSDLYQKWDDVDSATANLKAAQGTAAVSAARVRVTDARRAVDLAKKHLAQAKAARRRLDPDNDKLRHRSKLRILKPLDAAAASLAQGGADRTLVDEALFRAHRSRADMEAWSAVFVVTCVRAAAIHHKLETVDHSRVHRGRDVLLKANSAHSVYIMKARDRAAAGVLGTYHAFTPDKRIVAVGDIICTDRRDFIERPVVLKELKKRAILHGDIVTLITTEKGRPVAETIGGNVRHTVRRRRYPLDVQGRLIVSATELFAQESEQGAIALPAPLARVPTKLPVTSTRRVFALLSLVEKCRPQGKAAPARKDAPRGKNERFVDELLGSLESAFLDQDILQFPPQNQFMSRVERLVTESPFDRFIAETQVTRSRKSDATEHENDDEHLESSDAAGHDAEATDYSDDAEFDYSDGEDHAYEDTDPDFPGEAQTDSSDQESRPDENESENSVDFQQEEKDLAPAHTVDESAAQPAFAHTVRERVESLLDATQIREASSWNSTRHPRTSGIDAPTLRTRLDRYLDSAAIEKAMRSSPSLRDLSIDAHAVLAVLAHQFQQKIYASVRNHDGKIGEGTLDALGFVRHRGDSLNSADAVNVRFHVRGNSRAFGRIKEVFKKDESVFADLGPDVSPKTWYCLFVNPPFLGRPFGKGIHVELIRRLRRAERWLQSRSLYRKMSPVELGAALGIDEDHRGGRTTNNSSMHTLGLAVDIGYLKNPWVAGQAESPTRNRYFQGVSRNVSRLLGGGEEALTPEWLASLGADANRTTESAHIQIQVRHTALQVYLSLEKDTERLKTAIHRGSQGPRPDLVIGRGETIDAAARRWRANITRDRARLKHAFGSKRKPDAGFLNIDRNLVIALRDHGCLAWGAIDLGASQSGDMMHFDCRATGIGWRLAQEAQRVTGANHPCTSKTKTREELEAPRAAVDLAGPIDRSERTESGVDRDREAAGEHEEEAPDLEWRPPIDVGDETFGSDVITDETLARLAQGGIGVDGLSAMEARSIYDYDVARPKPSRVTDPFGRLLLALLWEPIAVGDEEAIRDRLVRLRRAIERVPDDQAGALLSRLGPGGDLHRDFTYRLATPTRTRIVTDLQKRARDRSAPTPQPTSPSAQRRPSGMVRVSTADVMDGPGSAATRQESLSYGFAVDRIVAKKQVGKTWWYEIEYRDQTRKGWVIGEKIAELAWPGDFAFTTPGSSGPFEDLRHAVRGRPVEDKVARAINNLNVQLLPSKDLDLGQCFAEAFYHALVSAKGNFKEACLIVTAAVRAFKPDTKGSFRWVQQPEAHDKKFNYAAFADKMWHFFWNAYERLDGTRAWTLRQLGLLYELKSRANPVRGFFALKPLDDDAKEDIAFNNAGIALADWLNKNHPTVTQHHAAVIRDRFLQTAVSMKLSEKQKGEMIQRLMKRDAVQTELQKRSYRDFAEAVEKHVEAALDAIKRMAQ